MYHHQETILALEQDEMFVIINDNVTRTYSCSVVSRQSIDGSKSIIGCNELALKTIPSGRLTGFQVAFDAERKGRENSIATGILFWSGLQIEEFRGVVILWRANCSSPTNEILPSEPTSEQ